MTQRPSGRDPTQVDSSSAQQHLSGTRPGTPAEPELGRQFTREVGFWVPRRWITAEGIDVEGMTAESPDGSWLATVGYEGTVRIWDPATGQQRAILTGHTDRVTAVAASPDGTWLATASRGQTVRIWDPATGQQRAALMSHTAGVTAVVASPDGTWLATTSDDRTVRSWDPVTGSTRALMRVELPVKGCVWSPSGRLLAVVGDAGLYLFTFNA